MFLNGKIYLSKHLFNKKLKKDNFIRITKLIPDDVNLIAVSKGKSIEDIKVLIELNHKRFGESRIQEAIPKIKELIDFDLEWHFIGNIQSNKIRKIIRNFDYIHSVDSITTLEKISAIAKQENKKPKVMIQVKFYNDPNKGGMNPEDLRRCWGVIRVLSSIEVVGLMTINPQGLTHEEKIILFKKCRELANQFDLKECSMGMSNDWNEAINAGSTYLRLGSALFGTRN
tara:strand:- start:6549 stop:7232 length:684 start_codon:yes stop_codon:yes gene_type:complete